MDEIRRERLHKVLARSGVASRRQCEEHIQNGRVRVDGQIVTELGTLVDPETQEIRFDEELVKLERPAHFLVFKPKGVVCTTDDQFRRTSVVDLVSDPAGRRLFPVGRIEEDSEGLMLVTNDGTFAHRLLRHDQLLRQTWFVRVRGTWTPEAADRIRQGVWLSDGKSQPMDVKVQRVGNGATTLLITPSGQQHRLLRRVLAKVGLQADKVVRVRFGPLGTHGLKKGESRRLTPDEVESLLHPSADDRLPPGSGRPARRERPGAPRGPRATRAGKGPKESTSRPRKAFDRSATPSSNRKPRPGARPTKPSSKTARTDRAAEGPSQKTRGRSRPATPARRGRSSDGGPPGRRIVGP